MFPSNISTNRFPAAASTAYSTDQASEGQAGGAPFVSKISKGLNKTFELTLRAGDTSGLTSPIFIVPPVTSRPPAHVGVVPLAKPMTAGQAEGLLRRLEDSRQTVSLEEAVHEGSSERPGERSIFCNSLSSTRPINIVLHLDRTNRLYKLVLVGENPHSGQGNMYAAYFAEPVMAAGTHGNRPPAWLNRSHASASVDKGKRRATDPEVVIRPGSSSDECLGWQVTPDSYRDLDAGMHHRATQEAGSSTGAVREAADERTRGKPPGVPASVVERSRATQGMPLEPSPSTEPRRSRVVSVSTPDVTNRNESSTFAANPVRPELSASTSGIRPPAWVGGFVSGKRRTTPPESERGPTRPKFGDASSAHAVIPPREGPSPSSATHGPAGSRREPKEKADAAHARALSSATQGELHAGPSTMAAQQEPVPLGIPEKGWRYWLTKSKLCPRNSDLFEWMARPLIRLDQLRLDSVASEPYGMSAFAKRVFLKSLAHRHEGDILVGTLGDAELNAAITGYANEEGMLQISLGMLSILPAVNVKELVAQQTFSKGTAVKPPALQVKEYAKDMHTSTRQMVAAVLEAAGNIALMPYQGRSTLSGKSLERTSSDPEKVPAHPFHHAIIHTLPAMQSELNVANSQASATRATVRRLVLFIEQTMDPWADSVLDSEHTMDTLAELFRAYRPESDVDTPTNIATRRQLVDVLQRVRETAHP